MKNKKGMVLGIGVLYIYENSADIIYQHSQGEIRFIIPDHHLEWVRENFINKERVVFLNNRNKNNYSRFAILGINGKKLPIIAKLIEEDKLKNDEEDDVIKEFVKPYSNFLPLIKLTKDRGVDKRERMLRKNILKFTSEYILMLEKELEKRGRYDKRSSYSH